MRIIIIFQPPPIVRSTEDGGKELRVEISFQATGKITTTKFAYDTLSFIGEVGGYTGLLLGISIIDIGIWLGQGIIAFKNMLL